VRIPRRTGEWIFIRQSIPVEIYIQPMSIYYGLIDKLYFPGEMSMGYLGHLEEWIVDLINLIKDKDTIKNLTYKYITGRKKKLPPNVRRILDEYKDDVSLDFSMKIRTIYGDVTIQPQEYNIVDDLAKYIEPAKDRHAFIKYINTSQQLKGKIAEQVFYMRSRGISYHDAIMMVSGNIKTQNLFYIEMHREYVKCFCRDWEQIEVKRLKQKMLKK